jgi:hypothetical protein
MIDLTLIELANFGDKTLVRPPLLSDSLFSMGSVINTEFRLGAKGENGIGKFAEASPPAPDFTAESSRNQFSQKLGKKFDFREGGVF